MLPLYCTVIRLSSQHHCINPTVVQRNRLSIWWVKATKLAVLLHWVMFSLKHSMRRWMVYLIQVCIVLGMWHCLCTVCTAWFFAQLQWHLLIHCSAYLPLCSALKIWGWGFFPKRFLDLYNKSSHTVGVGMSCYIYHLLVLSIAHFFWYNSIPVIQFSHSPALRKQHFLKFCSWTVTFAHYCTEHYFDPQKCLCWYVHFV